MDLAAVVMDSRSPVAEPLSAAGWCRMGIPRTRWDAVAPGVVVLVRWGNEVRVADTGAMGPEGRAREELGLTGVRAVKLGASAPFREWSCRPVLGFAAQC